MKLFSAPFVALAAAVAALSASALSAQAPAAQNQKSGSQVIFSRSADASGQETTTAGPAAAQGAGTPVKAPVASDEEREAVTFTDYDLDAHLHPADHRIAVRALVTVRNDGKSPLAHLPLQISSSLEWEQIRIGGRDMTFTVATLNSDVDHTGQLHEAAITLAEPLAPGATLQLTAMYSGTIEPDAKRLTALGTPDETALHSDWDAVNLDFTGLRGFGNVVWYPVASVPVILGDGARVFDEMGAHKLRMMDTRFSLRLTDEFPRGQAPTVALINGRPVPLKRIETASSSEEASGFALASVEKEVLGFEAPSLFVAVRKQVEAGPVSLWALAADESEAQAWGPAATTVAPFLEGWLGPHPEAKLTVLELPDAQDLPSEMGALVLTPLRQTPVDQLNDVVVHGLAHAYLRTASGPRPAWLDEGVAYFMSTLWTEKQKGRTEALESLESGRQALALAEPSSPGEGTGQPLALATSPVYYRTKAAYALWMLRDLVGDTALAAALRSYDPARDESWKEVRTQPAPDLNGGSTASDEFERLLESNAHRDLKWFFADWIDADKGLPDLAIDSVFPAPAQAGNTLVGVNLSNSGYATAEVSVTVRTAGTSITQRMLVPARGKAIRRILIQGAPTQVEANDGTVPETEASVHVTKLTDTGGSLPAQPGVPQ